MLVFYNREPVLEIRTGPDFQRKYGLHRDRIPDRDWGELQWTDLSDARIIKETPELKQTLLEDLAYTYGSNTEKFSEKLKEFNFI